MSCLSFIHRFISTLPDGQVFTTRDCLIYGKRTNVDKALQKLVKCRFIVRLARGVFARFIGQVKLPTILEMARIKAKAFGKELRLHGVDTAAENKLIAEGLEDPTFYVDGSTSSFQYCGRKIHLRKCSKKRMTMSDSTSGQAIRALWTIGPKRIGQDYIDRISHFWHSSNEEKKKIYLSKAWMPAWLGDFFPPTTYLGPQMKWAPSQGRGLTVQCDSDVFYSPFKPDVRSDNIWRS